MFLVARRAPGAEGETTTGVTKTKGKEEKAVNAVPVVSNKVRLMIG